MNTLKTSTKQPQVDLAKTTWADVQAVAKGEKVANGKMLFITRNLFSMYKNGKLDVSKYFDKTANDKAVKNIFFDTDNSRKTLIAKDFGQFTNLVLIPALDQNLVNFQKDFAYEYRVLVDVAPVILFVMVNEQYFNVENMLNSGIDLICAGLDQDSRGKPWETSAMLLGLSDKIIKIYGFCNVCGMEATKTYRKNEGGGRTKVGAADIYEPRCLKHWTAR